MYITNFPLISFVCPSVIPPLTFAVMNNFARGHMFVENSCSYDSLCPSVGRFGLTSAVMSIFTRGHMFVENSGDYDQLCPSLVQVLTYAVMSNFTRGIMFGRTAVPLLHLVCHSVIFV